MRRHHHYVEPEDDGLVPIPHAVNGRRIFKLVTPEEAHARACHIMAGFDDLSPAERYAWNYAKTTGAFNPSGSPMRYKLVQGKKAAATVREAGAAALLDELGL